MRGSVSMVSFLAWRRPYLYHKSWKIATGCKIHWGFCLIHSSKYQIQFKTFYLVHLLSTTWVLVQVNLCQELLFLHQLTHNVTSDCSFKYKFNSRKFKAQTWAEHVVYRNCFWDSEQFLFTTCSPHVLQKEELLTKIYLYW